MRNKSLLMMILVFALVFALFPATAMAQEQSEQIDVSGFDEVVESGRFKITSYGFGSAGKRIDSEWPMMIEAKQNHTITKVELAVGSTGGLTLDQIVPSRGAVSGNLTAGGTVVISDIYYPGVEISIPYSNGYLRTDKVTIYYEDTVASYKNTATAVHFNGMESLL